MGQKKSRLRLGIRAKFVLLVGGLLLLVFSVIALYLTTLNSETLRQNLLDQAKAFATLATTPIGDTYNIYKDSGTANIDAKISAFLALNKNVSNVTIIDVNGVVKYNKFTSPQSVVTREDVESFEPIYKYDQDDLVTAVIYPYKESNGAHHVSIVYTVSSTSIKKSVREAIYSVLFLSVVSMVSTLVTLYFFVNYWLIRKIRKLSKQSTAISEGDLQKEVGIDSNDEIGDLAGSVKKMADTLKADIDKLRELDKAKSEFMAITSHNLRTPLTIINGFVETTEDSSDIGTYKLALQQIAAGARRLNTFAEDVLTVSKLELTEGIGSLQPVNITEFLTLIAKDAEDLARLRKITLTTELETIERPLNLNRPYIRTAIWSLLDNAIKFTKEGGLVEVTLANEGDQVEIGVRDTGIGIPAEEITKLFTKFHRGTSTLTYNYEGTGIGLYSAKMIVERHGGEVHVHSELGVGSYFTIRLPFEWKATQPDEDHDNQHRPPQSQPGVTP